MGRLEDEDLKHGLVQLRSQEAFAQAEYDRDAELVKNGLIAPSIYDRARADWQAARAASAKAAAELDFVKLVAPADGVVIRRDGEIGQMIPVNQPVFWISVQSSLRISAEVDEEDIVRVSPGQDVLIRADAFPGQIFRGRVESITPKGDPVTRSYRVRMNVTETTPLQIGMTAETNIIVREDQNALLVPASAVTANRVWRVKDRRLEEQAVSIGANGKKLVEIVNGVGPDDLVVVAPDASLRAGKAVRPVLVSPSQ